MTKRQPKSGSKKKVRPPVVPKRPKPPTLEKLLADFRKVYTVQLNRFVAQFVDSHTDEDIEAFLPADVSEADSWIEEHITAFVENEEPTVDDMLDGLAAIFMMAFMERLYEACGITGDEDGDEGDPDDDSEDDEDDGDEDEESEQ